MIPSSSRGRVATRRSRIHKTFAPRPEPSIEREHYKSPPPPRHLPVPVPRLAAALTIPVSLHWPAAASLLVLVYPGKQSIVDHGGPGCHVRRRGRGPGAGAAGGRGLVAVRGVRHGGQRARGLRRAGAAGGVAPPRPPVRRRLPLPAQLPLRPVQRPDQARPRQLRRHRRLLLPVVGRRPRARRDRHGVHGQQHGPAGGAQHQRVGQRRRREGAAVLPLVRPGRRLPHLHHHLERPEHHLQGGRPLPPLLHPPRRPALPGRQAHGGARHALGRQLLGDGAGQGEGGLVRRALRRLLPRLHRGRLRARRRRPPALLPRRHRPLDEAAAQRRRAGHRRLGQEELHALRLLPGRLAVPAGIPRRMLPRLMTD